MSINVQQANAGTLATQFYSLLSGDPRPVLGDGANATLYETDTGKFYFHKAGQWVLRPDPARKAAAALEEVRGQMAELLSELKALRLGMMGAGTCNEV